MGLGGFCWSFMQDCPIMSDYSCPAFCWKVFEVNNSITEHPKGTDGPLETTHTDEAASSESSEANVEPGQEASDREDSESDAPYTPELDIVFDALVELAGDGRCWVPVRQIQAQTSLRLWRLEELTSRRVGVYGSHLQG